MATLFEFVCAQSPYKMRGLLLGYAVSMYIVSLSIHIAINSAFDDRQFTAVAKNSSLTALSLIGFVVHCLLGCWYKMRVRDEEYNVHRVVEEVYDRYLSQRPFN